MKALTPHYRFLAMDSTQNEYTKELATHLFEIYRPAPIVSHSFRKIIYTSGDNIQNLESSTAICWWKTVSMACAGVSFCSKAINLCNCIPTWALLHLHF